AHYLRGQGAGPEAVVGICLERGVELVVSLLGVLKAGAAYLPLDPAYPTQRLVGIAQAARLKLAIANAETARVLVTCVKDVIDLEERDAAIAAEDSTSPITSPVPQNPAYVIFTSGTTGKPKGVTIEHRQLVNYALAAVERLNLRQITRFATVSTLAADLGNTVIYGSLITGGTLHLISEDLISDGEAMGEYVDREAIECIKIVPSHLEALVGVSRKAVATRKVILGGEAVEWELVEALREAREGVEIYNHYGPTETTVGVIVGEIAADEGSREGSPRERITLGRPLANLRMSILDEAHSEVTVSVIGELHIGGAGVGRGYLNEPGLTAERFVPGNNGRAGERLYRTGDRARWRADGRIEFFGRSDGQVKLRGYRIELGEIESALIQHEAVRQCAVVVRQDEAGEKYLAAYVVGPAEAREVAATLRRYLREKLPAYMVPSRYVALEALPLTPNGKLDVRALPVPGPEGGGLATGKQTPRTATEEVLEGIWCQVLKRERVGVEDNFFEIGGHSLIATQVISRVRQAFQIELSVRRIFESPTIAGLAQEIEAAGREQQPHAPPLLRRAPHQGAMPLSFTQKGLWFFHQLEPESSYNSQVAIGFTGRLNLRALVQSLNEIMRRHETLRTIFPAIDGEPVQFIQPYDAAASFPLIDLGGLPTPQAEELAQSLLRHQSSLPFDLAKGPLARTFIVRLGESRHLLLLTMHHTVSDGWSGGVLFQELSALYSAFVAAEPSPLPELALQYADFACWQQEWLRSEAHDNDLRYWRDQLGGIPAESGFPTDRPRPAVLDSRGALEPLKLSHELSDALRDLSRRENVSMYMTLLAAFKALLHRYSGTTDIVIGSPIAGRNRAELEPLIGFFINTLVLRSDLSGDPSFSDLLKRVREVTLAAYLHQDMPFEKLVEEMEPERSLSRTPLFQVMFALQNLPARTLQLAGVTAERLLSEPATERFDLRLVMMERPRGLVGVISYNTALFESSTVRRIIRHYTRLLEAAAAAPHLKLSQLALLSESEEHQLIREWDSAAVQGRHSSALIRREEERTPETLAALFADARVYVLDRNLRPAPIGAVGEVYVGGIRFGGGHAGDAALAANHFIPDPLAGPARAWMRATGVTARYQATGAIQPVSHSGQPGQPQACMPEAQGLADCAASAAGAPVSRTGMAERRAQLASRRARLTTAKEDLLKQWLQEPR
ncbi:MAG TPA: amino acid adenylation domain-containing protein, partial [Blastocatellia bacterium]|nr:amino acid adenylation domain-containing protein [Blastocatellia bacterium]